MTVKLSGPSGLSESYTNLTWFNPHQFKAPKVDELPRNRP